MEQPIICNFFNKKIEVDKEPYKGKCSPKNEGRDKNKVNLRGDSPLKEFYDKHLFRKSLLCKVNENKEKSVFVILMNPSYADESGLDRTLKNVYLFLEDEINKNQKNKKYSQFEVLNIFPIRMAKSDCLPCLLKRYDANGYYRRKNLEFINKRLSSEKDWDIIIAWGKDYHLSEEAQFICNILKNRENVYAYNINNDYSPSHFASQVYNKVSKKELIPIKFEQIDGKFYIEQDKK